MTEKLNMGSFILSVGFVLLFFIVSFTDLIDLAIFGAHPLHLVLYASIFALVAGVMGLSGVRDWEGVSLRASLL